MKVTGKLFLFGLFALTVGACFDPPQFSNVPVISNLSIYFAEVSDLPPDDGYDTLAIRFHFTDGDGDDGLSSEFSSGDASGIFANHYFVTRSGIRYEPTLTDTTRYIIRETAAGPVLDTLITYSDRFTAPYDTLPAYRCGRYEFLGRDTVYQILNPNNYNVFVKLLEQDSVSMEFINIDFATFKGSCNPAATLNSRFPILFNDVTRPGALEGDVTYGPTSQTWLQDFGNKTLKLEITIQDRAFNKSNTLTTQPFRLDEIRK